MLEWYWAESVWQRYPDNFLTTSGQCFQVAGQTLAPGFSGDCSASSVTLAEWRVACTLKVQFSKNLLKTTGMCFLSQCRRNLSQGKKLATVTLCFSKVFLSSFGALCHVFDLENWNQVCVFLPASLLSWKKKEMINHCFWNTSKNWGGKSKSNL